MGRDVFDDRFRDVGFSEWWEGTLSDKEVEVEFWSDGIPKMASVYPDGASCGRAKICHVIPPREISEALRLRAMFSGRGWVKPGEAIARLFVDSTLWMSDTPDERSDHRVPVARAEGHTFIGGLGMGMVVLAAALKPAVVRVTVVELDKDVIQLAEPHLRNALESQGVDPGKLEIIEGDLMTWKPPKGQFYDCIWFDIWAHLCTDNLEEMATLNRRFARRSLGYRGSWGRELLLERRDQERRETWWRR